MIIKSAVEALLLKVVAADDEPNIYIMMGFSVFNLLLDLTNVFCFARAKHMMGYKTAEEEATVEEDVGAVLTNEGKQGDEEEGVQIDTIHGSSFNEDGDDAKDQAPSIDLSGVVDIKKQRPNLNMCSAYTHVFADTLRSAAVIIAVAFAMIFPDQISPLAADATAALVVSLLILLSLLPLLHGLWRSSRRLCAIWTEERSEIAA